LDEWERTHVAERARDGTPLLKCPRCWVELRPGHKVAIRSVPTGVASLLTVGQQGIVVTALEGGRVRASFGTIEADLRRDELFYVLGQPPVA
jgi:hypothetical protein